MFLISKERKISEDCSLFRSTHTHALPLVSTALGFLSKNSITCK